MAHGGLPHGLFPTFSFTQTQAQPVPQTARSPPWRGLFSNQHNLVLRAACQVAIGYSAFHACKHDPRYGPLQVFSEHVRVATDSVRAVVQSANARTAARHTSPGRPGRWAAVTHEPGARGRRAYVHT